MYKSRSAVPLRSVEDLADAKELRSVISAALATEPMDEYALRCAVWSFVGAERGAGVPPALIMTRLTALIDNANTASVQVRLALTRRVVLWCVEEYLGQLGGGSLAMDSLRGTSASASRA